MKKLLFFLSLFLFQQLHAQTLPYELEVDSSSYAPLENSISLINGQPWDDVTLTFDLGFDFNLYGQTTNQLIQYEDFAINEFGPDLPVSNIFVAYGADLVDRGYFNDTSLSPIVYRIDGDPGQRIYKVEWQNAGFYDDDTQESFINFQVWFYEGTNVMEVHFGPSQTDGLSSFLELSGPLVGFITKLVPSSGLFKDVWYLHGDVSHPEFKLAAISQLDTLYATLNASPYEGLVYRFSPTTTSASEPVAVQEIAQLLPTLVKDELQVVLKSVDSNAAQNWKCSLVEPTGRQIMVRSAFEPELKLNVAGLAPGTYFAKIEVPGYPVSVQKMIKQ